MKITVEYDSLEEFLKYHPSGPAKTDRVIPFPGMPDEVRVEPPEPPENPGEPQEEMRVEPTPPDAADEEPAEPIGPGSIDPAGDDVKTMEEIRAAFARLIETEEGWDQGAAMLDELECQKFGDVVATAQLTDLKKKLVEAGAM